MTEVRGWSWRERILTPPHGISLTKQEFKEEADINNIIGAWMRGGEKPIGDVAEIFGDFSTPLELRTALHAVIDAQNGFDELPSRIRNRMGNNPIALLGFLQDPANLEEGKALGLFNDQTKTMPTAQTEETEIVAEPPQPIDEPVEN